MADEAKIRELLATLDSDDLQARLIAITKIGELRIVEAVPKLIELLRDENDLVRMAAITALGDIGHISALRAVMEIAREEEAPMSILAELASGKILNQSVEQEKSESSPPEPSVMDDVLPQPEPAPAESEDGKADELENTIPLESIDLDDLIPAPKPIIPAGPAQAEIDELEHTGSMEPIDWDEVPAPAEASSEAELPEAPARESEEEIEPDRRGGGYGGTGGALPATEAQPEPPPPPIMPAPGGLPLPRPQPIAPPRMQSGDEPARRSRQEASPQQPVQFSAYYPREVKPDEWQPLQAYIFKESAADRVLEDAEKQLGPLDRFRRIVESARQIIREGDTITAAPNLPGFQFNPPSAAISFFEDWHRFDFKMRAKDAPLNLAANGFLTFTVNGIIVADIPLSVFVTHEVTHSQPQRTPPQPIYDTVFASYSHKDTPVVLKVEAVAKTFGMTYLRDVITLRSGEDWSVGLEKMIDDATIFQMFWSPPYSQSQHCKREWEYAVALKKQSPHFIRPVYWLQPMPDPPPPLQHLHFAYQPDLVK